MYNLCVSIQVGASLGARCGAWPRHRVRGRLHVSYDYYNYCIARRLRQLVINSVCATARVWVQVDRALATGLADRAQRSSRVDPASIEGREKYRYIAESRRAWRGVADGNGGEETHRRLALLQLASGPSSAGVSWQTALVSNRVHISAGPERAVFLAGAGGRDGRLASHQTLLHHGAAARSVSTAQRARRSSGREGGGRYARGRGRTVLVMICIRTSHTCI